MFKPDKTQPNPSKSHVSGPLPPKLHFNLLPFRYRQSVAEMCFTPVPLDDLYPFKPAEVPKELTALAPEGQMPSRFYTSAMPGSPGIPVQVSFNDHPALARLWCMQCIRRLLMPVVDYCRCDGPYATQFWCSTKRMPAEVPSTCDCGGESNDRQLFHRFTIKVLHRRSRPHPELLISYNGTGCILNSSLEELAGRNPDTRTLRRVAFRGKIYRWEELPETACYHYNEVLPLLSKEVAGWLQLSPFPASGSSATGNGFPLLSAFLKTHLLTGPFRSVVEYEERLLEAGSADTGLVPSAGGKLLFGEGGVSDNPVEGVIAHGPLQLPSGKHFSCFTVCFEEDEPLARKLFGCIVGGDASRQLGPFMRVPMRFSHDHSVYLNSGGNAEQQMVRRLTKMVFDPEITWCAFFICPPAERMSAHKALRLHARITELLLQRGVPVQKVTAALLEGDFLEPSRLLGLDLVARLGGIPWRPEGNTLNDPVAGFAVNPGRELFGPDMGAAVFFAPGGQVAGADVFNPANENEWGGLSMAFFRRWQQNGFRARRLVLHLPRPLKRRELTALKAMIDEGLPGVQVALMAVRRCRSRDIRVLNTDDRNGGIPDGTWVRCSNSRYLLYTCRSPRAKNTVPAPSKPLLVRFRLLNAGDDTIEQAAPQLLDQLHCLTRMHRPPSADAHLPVTLTYPALLARLMPRLRNKALPEYGRKVPWFI